MNTQPQMNGQQSQNGIGRATAVDSNHVGVEDVTEVDGGLVLRPNPTTSLEIQELIRAMETSNQLNHQRLQNMAQTIATQNAQINERFDRLLGQQNGQNGNQEAPNGVPAAGPQAEVQPKALGANPPQANPPAGGNPSLAINIQPIGNNPYVGANQFQGFLPYNRFRPQVHWGQESTSLVLILIVSWNRRIGRPVYRRPYPGYFDQEEFPQGFKVPNFALFQETDFSRLWSILADSRLNVLKLDIISP
ncbi:hypothetical protein L3X38_033056 [Prunus dulcis]|uniref:Uncharacterized protein n=1 Tax=Prunus dulcis TaxID=3755 RepID=A0AAD4VGD9_PRUDU|nr:hypothetical protein L3X38_033056 [Prunus dulcis]